MSNFLNQLNERRKDIINLLNFRERRNITMVEKDPFSIKSIRNPSEKVQLIAIEQEPNSIGDIKKPTPKAQVMAVEKNSGLITLIDSPCEEAQKIAVRQDPFALSLIKTSENVQIEAIKENPTAIQYIDNPSEVVQLAAVKQNPDALKYIENPSKETQRIAKELNNEMNGKEPQLDKIGRGKSENDLGVQMSKLYDQAGDNEIRKERILKAYNNVRNNLRSHGFGTVLGDSYRISTPEERLKPANELIGKKIEAIQILQGNAPERILEDKYEDIRDLFPESSYSIQKAINDDETGKVYKNIRMMSDEITHKKYIYQSAKSFSSDIKASLTPSELSKYTNELLKSDNLELGRVPTIKETLSLFSKEYYLPENSNSAVFENESSGKYEIRPSVLQYNVSNETNLQFIKVGTNPYSPNYKERFDNLGLKNEFQEFEELCVERDNFKDQYTYAMQCRDIAEIYHLDSELPYLEQRIADSRKNLYSKLNESVNCKLEGIKESLNDNGYEIISKEIQSNQTSIVEALKADNGSFQIKGVPVTEGRDKLFADITISKKGGNVTLSMSNLNIYNASAVDKMTEANGLLSAMSSQGIKSPLDIHRTHLQDLIKGSAVNVQTASGMKALQLANSPAGLTFRIVSGVIKQLDACAGH